MNARVRIIVILIASCVHLVGAAVVGIVLWALCPDWLTFLRALDIIAHDGWVRIGYAIWTVDIGLLAFVLGRYRTRRRGMAVTICQPGMCH